MKNVVSKPLAIALIVLFAFSILAFGLTRATITGSFTFKAWIDGTDYVYVQGGGATVWYDHTRSDLPGYSINGGGVQNNIDNHDNLPTYVDGKAWYPVWAGITTSWIDVPSTSDKYVNSGSYPTGEWNITSVTDVQARGVFQVVEYPSANNNYTAKILLDDILPSGAAWYQFTLNWQATEGSSQSNSLFDNPYVLGGAAAAAVTGVGAAAYAAKAVKGRATTGSGTNSGSSPRASQNAQDPSTDSPLSSDGNAADQQGQNPNTPPPNNGQPGAGANSGSTPASSPALQGDGQSSQPMDGQAQPTESQPPEQLDPNSNAPNAPQDPPRANSNTTPASQQPLQGQSQPAQQDPNPNAPNATQDPQRPNSNTAQEPVKSKKPLQGQGKAVKPPEPAS